MVRSSDACGRRTTWVCPQLQRLPVVVSHRAPDRGLRHGRRMLKHPSTRESAPHDHLQYDAAVSQLMEPELRSRQLLAWPGWAEA